MSRQYERRWLIKPSSEPLQFPGFIRSPEWMEQGYLETSTPFTSAYVRISDNENAAIAVKDGIGTTRDNDGCPVSLEAARLLMRICRHRVAKTRHHVTKQWAVDMFHGALSGVRMAQFKTDNLLDLPTLVPPEWMGPTVEVTDSLTTLHLARLATDLGNSGVDPLPVINPRVARKVRRVALAGGPGSGKDGVANELRGAFPEIRFLPETATIVISEVGIRPDHVSAYSFQETIYRVQRIFEATSMEAALNSGVKMLVSNRGILDGAAYLPGNIAEFERLFQTRIAIEYLNYDMVLFLETPSREIYERIKANNPARSEDYLSAMQISDRIRSVWQHHLNFVVIGNEGGWEGKVARARAALEKLLV